MNRKECEIYLKTLSEFVIKDVAEKTMGITMPEIGKDVVAQKFDNDKKGVDSLQSMVFCYRKLSRMLLMNALVNLKSNIPPNRWPEIHKELVEDFVIRVCEDSSAILCDPEVNQAMEDSIDTTTSIRPQGEENGKKKNVPLQSKGKFLH